VIRITVPGQPIAKGGKKASDDDLVVAYESLGSCAAVARCFGMCAQSVHERLVKLGANKPARVFTSEERDRLLRDYEAYVIRGDLPLLASEMGRTRHYLCRKAKSLGLTDPMRTGFSPSVTRSDARRTAIAVHGHPRGMAGKGHSQATKDRISVTSKASWDSRSDDERSDHVLTAMKAKVAKYGNLSGNKPHGSWKAAWRDIGGIRKYYRSRWEANYARYLQWLKERGEIIDWKHEPETFWFDAIKRGVRSYLPDFRVTEKCGASNLHEVKGWFDARSKTTLKRMAKYHPSEKIIVIAEREYKAIERKVSGMIEGWEK